MRPGNERMVPAALILALALARLVFGDPFAQDSHAPQRRHHEAPIVSPSAGVVLDGLAIGDSVGPLEVVHIQGPNDGQIAVELSREGRGMRAWVMRRGRMAHAVPRRTERFDLAYGPPSPGAQVRATPDDVALTVLDALAARIDGGGATVPDDM